MHAILRMQTTEGLNIHNVVIRLLRNVSDAGCITKPQIKGQALVNLIAGQSIEEPDGQDFETRSSAVPQHTFSHDLAATALPKPVRKDQKIISQWS